MFIVADLVSLSGNEIMTDGMPENPNQVKLYFFKAML